jgi:hypothetical protein
MHSCATGKLKHIVYDEANALGRKERLRALIEPNFMESRQSAAALPNFNLCKI